MSRPTPNDIGSIEGILKLVIYRDTEETLATADGNDPEGLLRDPERNERVELPNIGRKLYTEGMTLKQYREHPFWKNLIEDFRWHYGQPEEVRRAFRVAMGLEAGDN